MQERIGTADEVPDGGMDDPQQSDLELTHLGDLQGLQRRHAEAGRGGREEKGELDVGGHGPPQQSPAL